MPKNDPSFINRFPRTPDPYDSARQSAPIFIVANDDITLDCVQSANNGIGAAVHVSRDIDFGVINSFAIIDDGPVHHFTLIKER